MSARVFEETIEPFVEAIVAGITIPNTVLTAPFELEITMISQRPENWELAVETVQLQQLVKCADLITHVHDSLSQMLITE
jgi:hypothetical protein